MSTLLDKIWAQEDLENKYKAVCNQNLVLLDTVDAQAKQLLDTWNLANEWMTKYDELKADKTNIWIERIKELDAALAKANQRIAAAKANAASCNSNCFA